MTLLTVEGIYKEGKVELSEMPAEAPVQARVLVTFLPVEGAQGQRIPSESEAREDVLARIFADMKAGIDFGSSPHPKREELYDCIERYSQGNG